MSQPRFELPTLVTLTAPTCAGKNYLLEALVAELGFERIVSTTDRAAREGEIEGVHYKFISTEESKRLEADGKFAELVTYNGVRYGVTHEEMSKKMLTGAPPMVILEPTGLEIYRKYCTAKGWQIFSIYVETQESIRLERLVQRTTTDIVQMINRRQDEGTMYIGEVAKDVKKLVDVNNKRLHAILEQERLWSNKARWDVQVPGANLAQALDYVTRAVANRNRRQDVYK